MKHLLLILISVVCAGIVQAHSPYLLPNKFDLTKRDHVSVQASFTEQFLIPDVVMQADDYHVVMPDGARAPIVPVYTKDLAILDVPTTIDGTYRLSTGIRSGRTAKAALLADGKWQFFGEREGPPAGGKVHEIKSITRAEAYVSRGTPTDAALAPTNKGLEFQMLTHPNRLLAGAGAKIRVLYDGKPVPSQAISVQKAALEEGAIAAPGEVRTAADGTAALPFTVPGLYHLMARYRFALPGGEGKAESHTYAITLEVTE
jgi:uncharacterized GH25 family protein